MLFVGKQHFNCFPVQPVSFISFPCLLVLAETPSKMLNKNAESRYFCMFLVLGENTQFSTIMYDIVLSLKMFFSA